MTMTSRNQRHACAAFLNTLSKLVSQLLHHSSLKLDNTPQTPLTYTNSTSNWRLEPCEHNNMSHLYVCGLVLEKYVQNQSAENSAKLKTSSSVSRDCWEAHDHVTSLNGQSNHGCLFTNNDTWHNFLVVFYLYMWIDVPSSKYMITEVCTDLQLLWGYLLG